MLTQMKLKNLVNFLAACLLAGVLAACGGGGGSVNDGCLNIDPSRSSQLPGCGGGSATSPGSGTSNATPLTLSMVDATGAAFNTLMPDKPATLKVVLKNANGTVVPDAVVAFSTTDNTGKFSPSVGTALTDKDGAASVQLAAGSQAGAFTVTATAVVGTASVKASKTYTVAFPVLTMGALQITPSTLTAGGNASVTVTLMNGAVPHTQPVSVAFTSGCVAAGKATIGTPVVTQNGVATASYTDKGCSTSDTITATAILPNATLARSGSITIEPNIVGSLTFLDVTTSNIGLRGTGGPGRPEYSTVQFRVVDRSGNPVVGKLVTFAFSDTGTTSTTGGLSLYPASATSAADGTVATTVTGGTIPTSVRVTASTSGDRPVITTISSLLVVSSGVPDQAHFSLGLTVGNCEGWSYNALCSWVEVLLGDHFGNQVPDGTVVNFTAEGGIVEDSCKTEAGICKVRLYSANPRPAGGRVTVMAYLIGEETFFDANGNNYFDGADTFTDLSPDIFRDDNESGSWTAGEPCISPQSGPTNPLPPGQGCASSGDGQYNGVLRLPRLPQAIYLQRSLVAQFSTSDALITVENPTLTCTSGAVIEALVKVTDRNLNWMPAGTTINFSLKFTKETNNKPVVDPASIIVPNVVLGVGQPANIPTYPIAITCPTPDVEGSLIITVTSPNGVETVLTKPIL